MGVWGLAPIKRKDHDLLMMRSVEKFTGVMEEQKEGRKRERQESCATHATILLHKSLLPIIPMLLTRLDPNRPILSSATINLQILLVGPQIHLDPRRRTLERQDHEIRRLGRRVPWPIENERVIVSRAVEATLVRIQDIPSDLLRRGKVQRGTGHGLELTGWYQDRVDDDGARRVRHVQRVVEDVLARAEGKGVEVPVDVIGEHEGRRRVEGDGYEARGPLGGLDGVGGIVHLGWGLMIRWSLDEIREGGWRERECAPLSRESPRNLCPRRKR